MSWTVQYEANEIPTEATPAWVAGVTGDPLDTEEIVDGKLHVVYSQNEMWYERSNEPSESENMMEVKLKLVGGQLGIDIGNGDGYYFCAIVSPTGVTLYNDAGEDNGSYEMDTTDDYHTYRIITSGSTASLYVDSVLRAMVESTTPESTPDYYDVYSDATPIEFYIDYIYYQVDGAEVPEEEEEETSAISGREIYVLGKPVWGNREVVIVEEGVSHDLPAEAEYTYADQVSRFPYELTS